MIREQIKKLKENKAFTLIELIVVIAVLGILVLLAAPKFLGYTNDAKLTQIKADIKTYEMAIGAKLVDNPDLVNEWSSVDSTTMNGYKDENKLLDTKGVVDYDLDGTYIDIPEDKIDVKSNLKGDFLMDSGGKVYYYDANVVVKPGNNGGNPVNPGNPVDPVDPTPPEDPNGDNDGDGFTNSEEDAAGTDKNDANSKPTIPAIPYVAQLADFIFVEESTAPGSFADPFGKASTKGYLKYTGPDEEIIELPNTLNGINVSSYSYMFQGSNYENIKKVVSNNPNLVNTGSMFQGVVLDSLDLTELNTSKVTNMTSMFSGAKINNLNISNMSTENVGYFMYMFENSTIGNGYDLSSFNTSKSLAFDNMFFNLKTDKIILPSTFVINNGATVSNMFRKTNITVLDLTKVRVASSVNSNKMFYLTSIKTVEVGTQAEYNKLSEYTNDAFGENRPASLNFVLKP